MQGGQSREGEGAEVANVSVVVDTLPAGVHANEIGVERLEFLDRAGECVVEMQGHESEPKSDSRVERGGGQIPGRGLYGLVQTAINRNLVGFDRWIGDRQHIVQ